ncbi:MAG: hypothetical protein JWR35_3820 [Marmoricola sp.]|nr:hypothetical protein [Marmoricola sp.]
MPDPTPIAAPPPIAPQTPYFADVFPFGMYNNARWQISQHQFAAGVLLAQAAVEMGARHAFLLMLVRRHGPLSDEERDQLLPSSLSFLQDDCRALWCELTGRRVSRPKDPPVWTNYERHVHYRNAIAHGDTWGDSWGWQSVAAAGQFILRLDEHMAAVDRDAPDR